MTLPNFLLIGTGRAGTTAIYYRLMQHPDVFMCPVKETNFFAFEGGPDVPDEEIGFDWPDDIAFARATMRRRPPDQQFFDLDTYASLFRGVRNEIAIGEATPTYLYNPRAPARIQYHLPDARLIAILRQPVERAFSQFVQHVRDGNVRLSGFVRTLEAEADSIQKQKGGSLHYLRHGFYSQQLTRYYTYFPKHQLRIYRYEDLEATPEALMHDLLRFIGVDIPFNPKPLPRINASGIPQSALLDRGLRTPVRLKQFLKTILPATAVRKLAHVQNRIQNRNLARVTLPDDVRRTLTHQYYYDDIMQLRALTDLDVDAWLQ